MKNTRTTTGKTAKTSRNPEHLKTLPDNAVLLGRGKLTWLKGERVSDRYGSIWLMGNEDSSLTPSHTAMPLHVPEGRGRLLARVTDTFDSTHIGDMFRGLSPRTPKVGDIILLGEGTAFSEVNEGIKVIGLRPDDGRDSDWLDPRALYDCHESMVELIWSATEDKTIKALAH